MNRISRLQAWDKVKRHCHLKWFPAAKSSRETNVQAAFLSQLGPGWDVIQQTYHPLTPWYYYSSPVETDPETNSANRCFTFWSLLRMQITVAVAFPLLCRAPQFTRYTQSRRRWSGSPRDITAALPPVFVFLLIASLILPTLIFCARYVFLFLSE